MKIQISLFFSLSLIFLSASCKKEEVTHRKVFGRALEYGTNEPIGGATVMLFSNESDGFGSSTLLEDSVITDANGRFEMLFSVWDLASVKVSADGYFDSGEKILNAGQDNEHNFTLDPHAYLHLRVRNVAPAEEFDKIILGAYIGPPGGSSNDSEFMGEDVDESYIRRLRGNRDLPTGWGIYNSGVLLYPERDTINIPAHDTLYYEINY